MSRLGVVRSVCSRSRRLKKDKGPRVPALMLVGSPEATKEGFVKRFNEFEETKYHQPTDDVYKDWYWPGAKTVADMMGILGYRVAQADSMPTWLQGNKYSKLRRGDTLP
ncbi:MAG: hypothetical protein AAB288_05475 [Acidobacteriota bacterium]